MDKYKWNLFVVEGGEADYDRIVRVRSFAKAEKVAAELFAEHDNGNYPDLCVYCTPHTPWQGEYVDRHPDYDFPVYTRVQGEMQWNRMHVGILCLIGMTYDPDFINEIKAEEEKNKPRPISDLSQDELKSLYNQICWGSIFVSDYQNDLNVDEEEVYDYAESYSDELYDEYGDDWHEHLNAADFAEYCTA